MPAKIYIDLNGNSVSLLNGGVLIVGKRTVVQSVLDVVDNVSPSHTSVIDPFLSALQSGSSFSFVYGLPALYNSSISADRSLRGAKLVRGSLNFSGTTISGRVSFHTSNASIFVENYNKLDSASDEAPLVLNAPLAYDLSQWLLPYPQHQSTNQQTILLLQEIPEETLSQHASIWLCWRRERSRQ